MKTLIGLSVLVLIALIGSNVALAVRLQSAASNRTVSDSQQQTAVSSTTAAEFQQNQAFLILNKFSNDLWGTIRPVLQWAAFLFLAPVVPPAHRIPSIPATPESDLGYKNSRSCSNSPDVLYRSAPRRRLRL